MTTSPIDQLAQALDVHQRLVAGVRADQWTAPTPCTDWSVRDLVNHFVGGNRLFAQILRGDAEALSQRQHRLGRDHLGDDPGSAYRESADELLDALAQPGVLDQPFELPIGTVPGAGALQLRLVETLVHGWDLARATDQPVDFPAEIVEPAFAFTRSKLSELPPGLPAFAAPQAVADDAPALDQLAACLGRPVAGSSRTGV